MSASASASSAPPHGALAADGPRHRRYRDDDDVDDEARINAFLAEEGVPESRTVTASDITTALGILGYVVTTSSIRFVTNVVLLRLDCLAAVEGELHRDAAAAAAAAVQTRSTGAKTVSPPRRMSVLRWIRHLSHEDSGVSAFLRGGKAELVFAVSSLVEQTLVVKAMQLLFLTLSRRGATETSPGWSAVLAQVVMPALVASLLSWPMRTVRTTIRVNYMADTHLPTDTTAAQTPAPYRYASAWETWRRIRSRMGVRSLLVNGLDVDLASRAASLGLAWAAVQPASRWLRQVAMAKAGATTAGASSTPSVLVRLGQHRLVALGVLMAVAGSVNVLQRPFVVLRQRMALLPATAAEADGADGAKGVGAKEAATSRRAASARRGCRYTSGVACAMHVWRHEGVAALFAGLPLCLLVSTTVPLLQTFAGYPAAPLFTGTVV
ncbi:hypothetical protein NESM_000230900 [Novymonas esmeraldas]|uniref:Uncharacterized protein n=1 Tax=Novymonas esmeraldas TaxID=1808958 RepID=A0AAW0F646_9TRYP